MVPGGHTLMYIPSQPKSLVSHLDSLIEALTPSPIQTNTQCVAQQETSHLFEYHIVTNHIVYRTCSGENASIEHSGCVGRVG